MNQSQFACLLSWVGHVGATASLIAAVFTGGTILVIASISYSISGLATMLACNGV